MTTSTINGSGRLSICATPIGNMEDASPRVLAELETADVVYAEDTRVTRKLMSRFGLSTPLERCDEHATARRIPEIVDRVASGQVVAFVSDAGMPCVSDPGHRVVAAVREAGLPVTVLPGPIASVTAVAGCGFAAPAFYFGGFLPRKDGKRRAALESLSGLDALLVFYESNQRAASTARAMAEVFPERRVCMARELTKLHEEYLVLPSPELADELESRGASLKGEVVFVVEAPQRNEGPRAHVDRYADLAGK